MIPIYRFNPCADGLARWFGPLEAAVLEIVWAAEKPVTVKQVCRRLCADYPKRLEYTTVLVTMSRLALEKTLLERRRVGMAHLYWPRYDRRAFEAAQTRAIARALLEDA